MKLPDQITVKFYSPERLPLLPGRNGYLKLAGLELPLILQQGNGKRARGVRYVLRFTHFWQFGFKAIFSRLDITT